MTIEWYDNRTTGEMFVTTDNQQRLSLSASLCRELNCVDTSIKLFVGYDKVNKRIAIGKPDVVRVNNTGTMTFDKRHYASARGFIRDNGLPSDKAYRYVYDGKDKTTGALLFKLENYDAPDAHNR